MKHVLNYLDDHHFPLLIVSLITKIVDSLPTVVVSLSLSFVLSFSTYSVLFVLFLQLYCKLCSLLSKQNWYNFKGLL